VPHFIAEYSDNVADEIGVEKLFETVHQSLAGSGVFPLAGIRSRAVRVSEYRIADGGEHAFVHMELRIGHGRDVETLKKLGEALFAEIRRHFEPLLAKRSLALSLEISELHPVLNFKHGNIRRHLKREG
jgi:5-carboxymethyl-2-hydroxymuconate isomerase